MEPIENSVRQELIRRARDKRVRQAIFSAVAPSDWRFYQVLKPESGLPFTDDEAWNFIADLLEAGHPCHRIVLQKPPGQLAFVMKTPGHCGNPDIYIKVTLLRNKINGRSFHDSEY